MMQFAHVWVDLGFGQTLPSTSKAASHLLKLCVEPDVEESSPCLRCALCSGCSTCVADGEKSISGKTTADAKTAETSKEVSMCRSIEVSNYQAGEQKYWDARQQLRTATLLVFDLGYCMRCCRRDLKILRSITDAPRAYVFLFQSHSGNIPLQDDSPLKLSARKLVQ